MHDWAVEWMQGVRNMCKQYVKSEEVPWKVVQHAYEHRMYV